MVDEPSRGGSRLRLITIPISHYCEKARWGLDRTKVRYAVEGHMPVFHWAATMPRRGRTVPMLVTPHGTLTDSTDILRFADHCAGAADKIYPRGNAEAAEVLALEEEYDKYLGPATRRFVYFHTLGDKSRVLAMLGHGVSPLQKRLMATGFPVVRAMMRRAMKIDEPNTERSLARIRKIFDDVGARLRDGRRYLVGERFSVADLTFASLAAPVLFPDEYGVPVGDLADLPAAMRPVVDELRATPAGAFALKMFREERR